MNNVSNAKFVMCGVHIGGKEVVETLLKNGFKFEYFVIMSPEQSKKFNISGYYDYSEMAKENNIPIYYPKSYSLKDEEDLAFFEDNKFDLLIQGGWQRLFPDAVLSFLKIGAIGIHGSSEFLPRGRGRSPYNWSIIEGKKRFILHFFLIKPGIDDGDIFHFEQFEINEFDDINTMYHKGAILTKRAYLEFIPKLLSNELKMLPQKGKATYYPKRTPEDGKIDFESMDVDQIYNLIRAVTYPYPGAFAIIKGKKIMIWKATIFDRYIKYPQNSYGEVVEIFDNGFIVNCLSGLLFVHEYDFDCIICIGEQLI